MGLFDWINCDYPLPNNYEVKLAPYSPEGMQTKDLSNGMDVYRITADGRLLFEKYGEWREDKTGQYIDHTGDIEFEDGADGRFHAVFEKGQLQRIITHDDWLKEWHREHGEPGILLDMLNEYVKATLPPLVRRDSRE
jgi:hypothetical protein